MHSIITTFVELTTACALALTALGASGCYADVYDGDPAYYPSDDYVASGDPVYYDGQATYFYGGRWYYRDHGAWSYYRSEPGYLRQYRAAHPGVVRGARPAAARGGARGVSRGGGARGGGGHGGRR